MPCVVATPHGCTSGRRCAASRICIQWRAGASRGVQAALPASHSPGVLHRCRWLSCVLPGRVPRPLLARPAACFHGGFLPHTPGLVKLNGFCFPGAANCPGIANVSKGPVLLQRGEPRAPAPGQERLYSAVAGSGRSTVSTNLKRTRVTRLSLLPRKMKR